MALCALVAVCGPAAADASADTLSLASGTLTLTGTSSGSTVTLGSGTLTNEYRFASSAAITVTASADAICGPSAAVVECDDADVVDAIVVNAGGGVDDVSMTAALPTAAVTLNGQGGNDRLAGGAGAEALSGGTENDVIAGGPGSDAISGGSGIDTLSYDDGRPAGVTLNLAAAAFPDGELPSGIESFRGSDFNDVMLGGAGADALNGGDGDDAIAGGAGTDALDGGAGTNTLSYDDGRGAGVTVDLASGTFPDGETPLSFANVVGTAFADRLTGDESANTLVGGADADVLRGNGGPDILAGGTGADDLDGGAGADSDFGEGGADTIEARDGVVDAVDCGADADTAFADSTDALSGCETTIVAPPPPPPPPPPAPPPPPIVGASTTPVPVPVLAPARERLRIGVSAAFRVFDWGTQITRLTLSGLPAGAAVELRCTSPKRLGLGARCPFKRVALAVSRAHAALALRSRFKGRRLAPGTVIGLRVTAPGKIGSSVTFRLRAGRSPTRRTACLDAALKRYAC